jgi:transporter family protein
MLLAVLSAVFLGLYDVAKKAAVEDNAVLPVIFVSSLAGLALFVPLFALSAWAPVRAHGLAILPMSGTAHLLVVAKAALVTTSWVLTYFALKHLPISLASSVRASAPLFTLVGAVTMFGERPTARQGVGILVILLAYWAFSRIGRSEGIRFTQNRWVWMLFLGTLVSAASSLYDKHLLQSAKLPALTMQFWFSAYNAVIQGAIVALLWWPRRRHITPFRFRMSIVAVGVLLLIADALYFRALAHPGALVSVVSPLRRSNVVLSFAVGTIVFGERNRRPKAFALAGILIGIFLII